MRPDGAAAVAGLGALVVRHLEALRACTLREVMTTVHPLPAELASYLEAHRGELVAWAGSLDERATGATWSADPAGFAAVRWRSWLHLRNQYLVLTPAALAEAEQLHRAAVRALAEALAHEGVGLRLGLASAWAHYQGELASWLRRHLGAEPVEAVCAEYSAETQLRVLGLELRSLREPVLDVGCGAEARLVAALRQAGVEARGLDRHAEAEHTIAADWLDYRFAPMSWGTVISHLALSLHFVHRHLGADPAPARRYAQKYMEILQSLQLGGRFIYAPSLPFLEDMLPPQQYQVRRLAVEVPVPAAAAARPELQLASTTWVTRLG